MPGRRNASLSSCVENGVYEIAGCSVDRMECVVYKAGFVGFLVAGGMDAIVDSMTPIGCQGWPGLACQWLEGLKGRVSKVQSPQMLSFPHGRLFFRAMGKK